MGSRHPPNPLPNQSINNLPVPSTANSVDPWLRRRISRKGWAISLRGWVISLRGWVISLRGWVISPRGWVISLRGWVFTASMVRLGILIRRVMFTAVNVSVSILFQKFGAREVGARLGLERYFLTCHFGAKVWICVS